MHDDGDNTDGPALHPREGDFWRVATPRSARARLIEALQLELLGPASPTEELHESPISRYVLGMLAPIGTGIPEEEHGDELAADMDDETSEAADIGSPISQALTPSSVGLSFLVPVSTVALSIQASWGDYRAEETSDGDEAVGRHVDENSTATGEGDTKGKPPRRRARLRWKRTHQEPPPKVISLKPGMGLRREEVCADTGVTVEHVSRVLGERLAVSVFLVNRRDTTTRTRPPVDRWIFQPKIVVQSQEAEPLFPPRELEPALAHSDRDRESNRLLFRDRREFAVGHGCAAEWSVPPNGSVATTLWTTLFPSYELRRVVPIPVEGDGLSMAVLASTRLGKDFQRLLEPVCEAYEKWIVSKRSTITALPVDLQSVAASHLDDCVAALVRMRRGLEYLTRDTDASTAFRFANEAMLLQRSHTIWARERRRDPIAAADSPTIEGRWRPFQLAFILLNLPGLIDEQSEDRLIGDLLWFPTGGGKTEAYLGLAAFTMALRRRRTIPGMRTDAGLTVLMRYTLRLLTLQQFQRAATLLCACEAIRVRDTDTWGTYRFSIGLWLGKDGTPNTHDDSRRSLMRLQKDPFDEGANPCVLESCPWCGEQLTANDYWVDGERIRTRVACPRVGCLFSRANSAFGLPVVAVDEEIYRECPSMLIATVDKFAQMPWNGEVQSLFGFVNRECPSCGFLGTATDHGTVHRRSGAGTSSNVVRETERLAPPDLIIQDELHLISGPLGTLVALYETAVDFLASRPIDGRLVGPKILASTATVRRAFEQVQAIFQRNLRVFPPPGLDPGDSFFAVERDVGEDAPGRLYVGVCASGKSMATAYVRVASSLFSSAAGLRVDPAMAEPYLTLVSYFNSLRELGGAIRLMDDDIPGRLEQLKSSGLPRRQRPIYRELTSRIRQEDIPDLLRRLEQRHDAPRTEDDPLPLDAVLASNMISVGVDVDRLGLMVVRGQPKSTAEYIQATSRVGRQPWGPGLVVTIYNWARPRDLSHYERFHHYHATLYRNVEAVSATPFSSRALDRGLRGAFVAMVRLGSEALSAETSAARFNPRSPHVERVIEAFRRRAAFVVDDASALSLARTLKGLGDEWWAFRINALRYGWRSPSPTSVPTEDVLLRVPEGGRIGHWPSPQSLREVEEQSFVRVIGADGKKS